MKLNSVFLIFLASFHSMAADVKYPVSAIPEELKQNADVVVREDHMEFKILSRNHAIWHVHQVHTIFNENGNEVAKEVIGYDKLTRINEISGTAYDAMGKQIKRLKKSEIYDQASFDGVTLFSDDRIKRIDLTQAIYPYTVEIEYEIEFKFLFNIPSSWWGGEKTSYEHASYTLVYPAGLEPRYQLLNIKSEPVTEKLPDGFQSVTWKFENLKPNKLESQGPAVQEIIPHILAAPSSFQFETYPGTMTTWAQYGNWQAL